MKIAQIAPLMESVPPRLYGGTERIVAYLTEELVAKGHEVTLFASAHPQSHWDVGTHMTKKVWDRVCRRVADQRVKFRIRHQRMRRSHPGKNPSPAVSRRPNHPYKAAQEARSAYPAAEQLLDVQQIAVDRTWPAAM